MSVHAFLLGNQLDLMRPDSGRIGHRHSIYKRRYGQVIEAADPLDKTTKRLPLWRRCKTALASCDLITSTLGFSQWWGVEYSAVASVENAEQRESPEGNSKFKMDRVGRIQSFNDTFLRTQLS